MSIGGDLGRFVAQPDFFVVNVEKVAEPRTLYVKRPLLNADAVRAHFKDQGLDEMLASEDMHVTICYSDSALVWDESDARDDTLTVVGGPREVHQFEPRNEKNGATVLRFESSDLNQRHAEIKARGATWDFPEYLPHVTLTYSLKDEPQVEPYRGPLVFGPEVWRENEKAPAVVETVLKMIAKVYDPNQPRDDQGQWTSSGGNRIERSPEAQKKVDGMIDSLRDSAEQMAGSLRERLVVMDRVTGEVIDDREQELELRVSTLTHELKEGSQFSNANMFNRNGEYHPDNSILDLHTHPIDQSFSDGDWRVFARHTIGEMRVVSANKEFSLVKTEEFLSRPWQERTPAAIDKIFNRHVDAVSDAILAARTHTDDFATQVIDEANVRTAKELGVKYRVRSLRLD